MRLQEGDEWLTTTQVCQEFNIKYPTLIKWIMRGDLPATKFGKDWRVKRSDFEAFGVPSSVYVEQFRETTRRLNSGQK